MRHPLVGCGIGGIHYKDQALKKVVPVIASSISSSRGIGKQYFTMILLGRHFIIIKDFNSELSNIGAKLLNKKETSIFLDKRDLSLI